MDTLLKPWSNPWRRYYTASLMWGFQITDHNSRRSMDLLPAHQGNLRQMGKRSEVYKEWKPCRKRTIASTLRSTQLQNGLAPCELLMGRRLRTKLHTIHDGNSESESRQVPFKLDTELQQTTKNPHLTDPPTRRWRVDPRLSSTWSIGHWDSSSTFLRHPNG